MKVIIIGGGAAGFFAAINAGELYPEAEITILEKTHKLLSKVLVSGGGRCNVTHASFDPALLVKNYPRGEKELRSAFSKFSSGDTVDWFEQHGVTLKTDADGRMFPETNQSETIVHCLLDRAEELGVKIKTGIQVTEIETLTEQRFRVQAKDHSTFSCDKLIIAIGGSQKTESYDFIKKMGHQIVTPVPSLFTFNIPDKALTERMGISVPQANVSIEGHKLETTGPLLITHWGLSGPAILKASAWGARLLHELNYQFTVTINWVPAIQSDSLRDLLLGLKETQGDKNIGTYAPFEIPKRLWEYFLLKASISENYRWADINKKQIQTLLDRLQKDRYQVSGKTTFKEEFVTCGGISLKEVNFSTMESKLQPNLYFAGEVLDIDGITGGFNFQNAWTSAWIAAHALGKKRV